MRPRRGSIAFGGKCGKEQKTNASIESGNSIPLNAFQISNQAMYGVEEVQIIKINDITHYCLALLSNMSDGLLFHT